MRHAPGLARANALAYGLGGSVFARRRGLQLAWRMRSGMTAVNSVLSFAAMPSLPYGGVGDSGFGRIHGNDGLREFARPKAITARRAPSPLPAWTFARDPATTGRRVMTIMRLLYGHPRPPQPLEYRPSGHWSSLIPAGVRRRASAGDGSTWVRS